MHMRSLGKVEVAPHVRWVGRALVDHELPMHAEILQGASLAATP